MREIEFRGYDKENECWRYGGYAKTTIPQDNPFSVNNARLFHVIITDGTYWYCEEDSIGQYIDVDDHLGAKIFEGDCVADLENPKWSAIGVVESSGATDWGWGQWGTIHCALTFQRTKMQVVGNVYEHPHLKEYK